MGQRTLTSTARRRRAGIVLAGLVFVGACSSGSSDETGDAGGNATTSPTTTPASTAAPTTTPETTDGVETTPPATTSTNDSIVPDETGERPPTLSELEDLAFEGEIPEIDVALTEFAVVTGVEIEGALPVTVDEFVPDELTSVMMRLQVLDDQLTDRQRQQIEEYLDEIRSSALVVIDSTDAVDEPSTSDDEGTALGIDPPDDSGISAFAGRLNRPTVLTSEELMAHVHGAEEFVMRKLGGVTPRWQFVTIAPEDRVGEQLSWAGWANTREVDGGRICQVRIVDFPGRSQEELLSTIVHEYFHCWHGANFPGAIEGYWGSPRWVVEGLATWVSSEASGEGIGSSRARQFLDARVGRVYGSSYDAIGFYWQLNHLDGGPDALWGRIPNIIASGELVPSYRAATAGLSNAQLARLGSSGTRKSDWGDEWTFANPGLSGGARPVQQRSVRGVAYEFARATEQVAIEFDFTDGDERPRLIELIYEGLTVSAWHQQPDSTTTTGPVKTTWCLNPECVCEDGEPIPDAIPVPGNDARIIVALTGAEREQASIEARVASMDDACEDEVDLELTGIWIADPAALVAAYDQAYQQIGISVTGAAGELSLTLFPDGVAELRYDEMRLGLSDPFVDEVIITGKGTLGWQVLGGQLIFSEVVDFTVSVVTPAISNDPITFTAADLPFLDGPATTTMDYVREGSSLTMSNLVGSLATLRDGSPGVLVFPTSWTRAGDAP